LLNFLKELTHKKELQLSQIVTLLVIFAILLAPNAKRLELMLYLRIYSGLHTVKFYFFGESPTLTLAILLIITENKLPLGVNYPNI
jgi:SSS family solute:Na+ symporter